MKTASLFILLSVSVVISTSLVTGLFLASEKTIERNNTFIRRYPHHPVQIMDTIDLRFNSYYFAGVENDTIYLGNTTAPLYVMGVSIKNRDTSHIDLQVPDFDKYRYGNLLVKIKNGRYYLYDGSVPVLFTAKLRDTSKNKLNKKVYFDHLQVIDSSHFWIRSRLIKNDQLELGLLDLRQNSASFNSDLLTKKVDGFFDVDGMMTSSNNKLFYPYFYRNQYLVINQLGELIDIGKTIDTLTQAKIEIIPNNKQQLRKLASHPTLVNLYATAWDNYLFIQSSRLGKYEPEEMLREASIIDVYDHTKNTYEFSFYLYDHFGTKAREFRIYHSKLFGLYDKYLTVQTIKISRKKV